MSGQNPDFQRISEHGAHSRMAVDAGCSSFKFLREGRNYYVDKTAHLPDLLCGHGPLLLTRPRRFGKTLTLDTLHRFLELDYRHPGDTSQQQRLFSDLAIMQDPLLGACRKRHMGQHPVLSITFNNVEGENFEGALLRMRDAVASLFTHLKPQLEIEECISDAERRTLSRYDDLLNIRDSSVLMELLPPAMPWLCSLLHRVYSRSVYILIDEYDAPLARAWGAELRLSPAHGPHESTGYYGRMLSLMRGLLLPLLKPQPSLQESIARCICTGCTRISRESLFSGANNLVVLGPDDLPTADLMGFTEKEVSDMLSYYGFADRMSDARRWYDGYRFAGVRIYNPWSIAHYCQDICRNPSHQPRSFWANAGLNNELSACLQALPEEGLDKLRKLCDGEKISLELMDFFSYDELLLSRDQKALFALLYHTGYITRDDDGSPQPLWRIPNEEVRDCFMEQILGMYEPLAAGRGEVSLASQLGSALLRGRPREAQGLLERLFERYLSFHALALRSGALQRLERVLAACCDAEALKDFRVIDDRRPERIYQIYAAGVLCTLCPDQITELGIEQELGEGHADLSFISAAGEQVGCVLEFKKAADVSPGGEGYQQRLQEQCRRAARQGQEQIDIRGYAAALLHLHPALRAVHAYGIGCSGKRCAAEWRCYGREELSDQS